MTLIDRSVPLADMTISCASVLLPPSDPAPVDTAEMVTGIRSQARRTAGIAGADAGRRRDHCGVQWQLRPDSDSRR